MFQLNVQNNNVYIYVNSPGQVIGSVYVTRKTPEFSITKGKANFEHSNLSYTGKQDFQIDWTQVLN